MHFRPSCVHFCYRVLCSTYKGSPLRVLLSEFPQLLVKKGCLIWPLSCRSVSNTMFVHICRNKVIRCWILDIFISTRNASSTFAISVVMPRPWSCSKTCSSTSSYILFTIFLRWDFVQRFLFLFIFSSLSGPLTSLPLVSCSASAQVFQGDLLRFTQPLSIINNWHSLTLS